MSTAEQGRDTTRREPEDVTIYRGKTAFSGATIVSMADFYRARAAEPEEGAEPQDIEADQWLAGLYSGMLQRAGVEYPRPETETQNAAQEQIAAQKKQIGDLTENRTPIARMKTWCPSRQTMRP